MFHFQGVDISYKPAEMFSYLKLTFYKFTHKMHVLNNKI
jgi:hypothetical protein